MAPEVIKGASYTSKADVYSFSIIIFEILFQTIPYNGMLGPQIINYVMENGRPIYTLEINNHYKEIVDIMEKCWRANPEDRPDFE